MSSKNDQSLMKYAGMTAQFFISIGIGLFAGLKIDKWCKFKTPLFIWVLPLLIIVGLIIMLIKETTHKKNGPPEK